GTGHLLHILIVDFVSRVRRLVIVFVLPAIVEDYWNAFLGVGEVVAAKEQLTGILRVIEPVIEGESQIRLVDRLADLPQLGTHLLRSDDVDLPRLHQRLVGESRVATGLRASYHVEIQIGDYLVQRDGRMCNKVLRSPAVLFFAAVPDEED